MDWEKPCSTAHTFILKSFLARATRVHLADIQRSQGTKCLPEGYKDLTKTCQGMSTKICYPNFWGELWCSQKGLLSFLCTCWREETRGGCRPWIFSGLPESGSWQTVCVLMWADGDVNPSHLENSHRPAAGRMEV